MGRPRAFDMEETLDRALRVFWKYGYEGATLPQLTEAMGINRPSMYAAFGNKEALFRKVMDRYGEKAAAELRTALEKPTAREVVETLLSRSAALMTDSKNPPGCLGVHGALACADSANCVREDLSERRALREQLIRERFERAKSEGDLPRRVTAADLARYVTTVLYGMSVQAAGGASRAELRRVVSVVMEMWPREEDGAGAVRA